MRHPLQSVSRVRQAFLWFVLATVLVAITFQVLGPTNPGVVDLELAFSLERTTTLLSEWSTSEQLRLAFGLGLDYLFMPLYATTIALAAIWVTRGSSARWRSTAALVAWGVYGAALFDAVENVAMFRSLLDSPTSATALVAGICATVKFALIIVGIVFVVVALVAGRPRSRVARVTRDLSSET